MFDSNRNLENILYKKEFDRSADLDANSKIVYTLDVSDNDWKGERGFIDKAMLTRYLSPTDTEKEIKTGTVKNVLNSFYEHVRTCKICHRYLNAILEHSVKSKELDCIFIELDFFPSRKDIS